MWPPVSHGRTSSASGSSIRPQPLSSLSLRSRPILSPPPWPPYARLVRRRDRTNMSFAWGSPGQSRIATLYYRCKVSLPRRGLGETLLSLSAGGQTGINIRPMNPIFLIFVLSAAGVLADVLLKVSGNGTRVIEWRWFVAASAVYMLTVPGWFLVIKYVSLSSVGALYSVATILLLVGTDMMYFRKSLGPQEIVGIAFALVAVLLLRRIA